MINSLDDVASVLGGLGYDELKFLTKTTRIAVVVDEDRYTVLGRLENQLKDYGATWCRETNISSIGHIVVNDYYIAVKSRSQQGNKSAGLMNEEFFVNTVSNYLSDIPESSMSISFTGLNKTVEHKNVSGVASVGSDTKNRKKADVCLLQDDGKYVPISLKMSNAQTWESADKYWGANAAIVVNYKISIGDVEILDHPTKIDVKKLSSEICVEATDQERYDVIFGSDIHRLGGCVLKETFNPQSFSYIDSKNLLNVSVKSVITEISDVRGTDEDVMFLIRNDSTRNNKLLGIKGLRTLASYRSRAKTEPVQRPLTIH